MTKNTTGLICSREKDFLNGGFIEMWKEALESIVKGVWFSFKEQMGEVGKKLALLAPAQTQDMEGCMLLPGREECSGESPSV